ncbi:MAG TPA: ABC transporter substrate-binding protein [Chitinophagales bacterium]|nr:ABC transporter substrate-binding protein [Chitinophagales bacterium]
MRRAIYLLLLTAFFNSCGVNENSSSEFVKANGNVYYGGTFRMNEIEDFRHLFPLSITEETSQHIAYQIYEGLVKLSQSDLTILPCLAERWEKNENATVWTFHLRKDVKFHDDPCFEDGVGREVDANDFNYCFQQLCTAIPENQQFNASFKGLVLGANEYYQSTISKTPLPGGVAGIKVIDDQTLQITLEHPFAGFLNVLATAGCMLYPREAFEKYGAAGMRLKCIGTGPFRVKNIKLGEIVSLERNPNYWGKDDFGNQLPYLDKLKYTFFKEKKVELMEFKKRNLDMMYRLPIEMVPNILGELDNAKEGNFPFEIQIVPAMSVYYFGFQHQGDIFDKKEVRLAFNYAIDRERIVDYVLQGEGVPANSGIVPPSFKNYEFKKLKGYTYDVQKAQNYLAAAGYPNGKGFPKLVLQINSGGNDRNIQIAEITEKMLKKNLNIDINIVILPFSEHLDRLETGQAQFWRSSWNADYPDPSAFLILLYGKGIPEKLTDKSSLNTVRYKSAVFDSLFEAAAHETNDKKRYDLYLKADQQAIDDGAIMPLFYDESYRLIQPEVMNFPANALEYRDLSRVYFIPQTAKAKTE